MIVIHPVKTGIFAAVQKTSEAIVKGGIVAYPTETFYGLGVKFDDNNALGKLYRAKNRSRDKALPLIIGDKSMLYLITSSITPASEKLIETFWPGPLTLLLPAKPELSDFITAETGKVAVRVPGESFALHLARALAFPITATSANISGMPPAENTDEVVRYFGALLDLVIDCGKTQGGQPSTIVDASGEKILIVREGAIPAEKIFAAL